MNALTIYYFASFREQLDTGKEKLDVPKTIETLAELRQHLCLRGTPWSEVLGENELVMMSQNQNLAEPESLLSNNDEIAFFPPVTGG